MIKVWIRQNTDCSLCTTILQETYVIGHGRTLVGFRGLCGIVPYQLSGNVEIIQFEARAILGQQKLTQFQILMGKPRRMQVANALGGFQSVM